MVIPNATHINGIPVEDYKPTRRDLRKGLVVTVADPAAVSASAVTSTTGHPVRDGNRPVRDRDDCHSRCRGGDDDGGGDGRGGGRDNCGFNHHLDRLDDDFGDIGGATSIFGAAVAAAVPAVVIGSELAPDGDYLSALVQQDGQKLRVTLVDRSSGKPISAQISELPAAGASVIHVSGLGADAELEQALRAYATVCEVNLQSVVNWAQQPGTTSRTSAGFALMTDTCPGLWKYARPNR